MNPVVIDTNCLLQIISRRSPYRPIWDAFLQGRYQLCVSNMGIITADPDDNKFVDCAVIAGATYIVSNDRHFDELKRYDFPKVDVRKLSEFLNIVRTL